MQYCLYLWLCVNHDNSRRQLLIFLTVSRRITLAMFTTELVPYLKSESELKVCVDIISDLLVTLNRDDVVGLLWTLKPLMLLHVVINIPVIISLLQGQTFEDINQVAIELLFPILKTVIRIDRVLPYAVSWSLSILISIAAHPLMKYFI